MLVTRFAARGLGLALALLLGSLSPAAEPTEKQPKPEKQPSQQANRAGREDGKTSRTADRPKSDYVRAAEAAAARSAERGKPLVFSNDDLPPAVGGSTPAGSPSPSQPQPATSPSSPEPGAPTAPGEATDDPLTWMEQRAARQAEQARMRGEADAAVAAAQSEVQRLERELLAARNPFVGRPPGSADSTETPADPRERQAQLQSRLKAAREALREAVARRDSLRRERP
jgi:hypothetical protein